MKRYSKNDTKENIKSNLVSYNSLFDSKYVACMKDFGRNQSRKNADPLPPDLLEDMLRVAEWVQLKDMEASLKVGMLFVAEINVDPSNTLSKSTIVPDNILKFDLLFNSLEHKTGFRVNSPFEGDLIKEKYYPHNRFDSAVSTQQIPRDFQDPEIDFISIFPPEFNEPKIDLDILPWMISDTSCCEVINGRFSADLNHEISPNQIAESCSKLSESLPAKKSVKQATERPRLLNKAKKLTYPKQNLNLKLSQEHLSQKVSSKEDEAPKLSLKEAFSRSNGSLFPIVFIDNSYFADSKWEYKLCKSRSFSNIKRTSPPSNLTEERIAATQMNTIIASNRQSNHVKVNTLAEPLKKLYDFLHNNGNKKANANEIHRDFFKSFSFRLNPGALKYRSRTSNGVVLRVQKIALIRFIKLFCC
ncbi:hypothetical protein G9A89_001852 [Geosiphon pyriformis]|nr:hypothetical protein G9A89_001852 [Geosiphon pyriformis]